MGGRSRTYPEAQSGSLFVADYKIGAQTWEMPEPL